MKKTLFPVLALALLASCTNNDEPTMVDDPNEIKASMSSLSISTKSPYEGTITTGNPLVARVLASQTSGNYTTEYQGSTNGYMKFTNENDNFGFTDATGNTQTPKFYPATENAEIYLFGLYPADLSWNTTTSGSATAAITGKEDIMVAPQVSSVKNGTVGKLAFTHKLTKLIIKFDVEDQNSQDAWGTITGLQLSGVYNGSNLVKPANSVSTTTTASPTVTFTGNADMGFYQYNGTAYSDNTFASCSLATITPGTPQTVAYVLCQPIPAANVTTATDYQITVSNANTSRTVPINLYSDNMSTAFTGNTEGYAFEVTLNFKATEIVATASVTDWQDGGSTSVDVE